MTGHGDIRIGTLVQANGGADYIRRILPHGFESFSITFGADATGIDIVKLAEDVKEAIAGSDAVISSLGVYGNPLEGGDKDRKTLESWEMLIENASLFGTNIVSGFAGRLRGRPVPESIERFSEVFSGLALKAGSNKIKIAFENCPMGGTWETGDYNIAFNPSAWELMFEALPGDNLGLQWEPCHQMAQLIDPLPQLRRWAKKIFHLHGKCATVRNELISERGIIGPEDIAFHRTPGFGDLNWKDVISELRMGGFSGSIDIEGWHDPVYRGELEMTGQVRALNYLKDCRGGDFIPNP